MTMIYGNGQYWSKRIKMQKWKKLGLIFNPNNRYDWMYSHAQLPVLDHIENNIFRVYFASRTKEQKSHIGYVEIDITQPKKILNISSEPILKPGPIGFFDEHGVYPSSILNVNEKKYLYYIGWNQGNKQPLFYAHIGLAISEDGGETFKKYSKAPIMGRSEYDPCLVTSPNVFIDDDGVWKMTYVSGIKWEEIDEKLKSYYHIKYAESEDGINWKREGNIAIDFSDKTESNIARPSVIKENGIYKMWYSYIKNNKPYKIGYAESKDSQNWIRKDKEVGITVNRFY